MRIAVGKSASAHMKCDISNFKVENVFKIERIRFKGNKKVLGTVSSMWIPHQVALSSYEIFKQNNQMDVTHLFSEIFKN